MRQQLRISFILLTIVTLVTGTMYPAVVTLIAQAVFPRQANGSIVSDGNRLLGSELIGQSFSNPRYFWGRPSATSPFPYNAAASNGSNFGPMNPVLGQSVQERMDALRPYHSPDSPVPVDLATSSSSGLDPHISPAAAEFQVSRVADERKMERDQVRALVRQHTEGRQLGVLGEPRVNVLRLNRALDRVKTTR